MTYDIIKISIYKVLFIRGNPIILEKSSVVASTASAISPSVVSIIVVESVSPVSNVVLKDVVDVLNDDIEELSELDSVTAGPDSCF